MEDGQETELRFRTYRALVENPEWQEVLTDALQVEAREEQRYRELGYGEWPGWEWYHVSYPMPSLHRMVASKLLAITLKTRSATHFRVRNPQMVRDAISALQVPRAVEKKVPEDLFAPIVGHDNIKQILRWAIDAKERVAVLLQGPPASAKTLFLMELARLPDSYYCLAQMMSGPGLAQALRVYEPRFIIIDEIDRLDSKDVGVLNSLMATGLVVEAKVGKGPPIQLETKTFAAGIDIRRLPVDLLSRFIKLRFPPYTPAQFAEVCLHILPKEGCDGETAALIAKEVWAMRGDGADIREAVQIARLAQGDRGRAEEILRTLRHQGA